MDWEGVPPKNYLPCIEVLIYIFMLCKIYKSFFFLTKCVSVGGCGGGGGADCGGGSEGESKE